MDNTVNDNELLVYCSVFSKSKTDYLITSSSASDIGDVISVCKNTVNRCIKSLRDKNYLMKLIKGFSSVKQPMYTNDLCISIDEEFIYRKDLSVQEKAYLIKCVGLIIKTYLSLENNYIDSYQPELVKEFGICPKKMYQIERSLKEKGLLTIDNEYNKEVLGRAVPHRIYDFKNIFISPIEVKMCIHANCMFYFLEVTEMELTEYLIENGFVQIHDYKNNTNTVE